MAESVMPFSCRIRSTTARWSDLGATRCATSHTVSPAPTRVSVVSAGTTGLAAWPIQLAPPTTANVTAAAAASRTALANRGARMRTCGASHPNGIRNRRRTSGRRTGGARGSTGAGGAGSELVGAFSHGGLAPAGPLATDPSSESHAADRLLNCAGAVIETPSPSSRHLVTSNTGSIELLCGVYHDGPTESTTTRRVVRTDV